MEDNAWETETLEDKTLRYAEYQELLELKDDKWKSVLEQAKCLVPDIKLQESAILRNKGIKFPVSEN